MSMNDAAHPVESDTLPISIEDKQSSHKVESSRRQAADASGTGVQSLSWPSGAL
jgi:hypothetical protein